jgi:hypothetical protein
MFKISKVDIIESTFKTYLVTSVIYESRSLQVRIIIKITFISRPHRRPIQLAILVPVGLSLTL